RMHWGRWGSHCARGLPIVVLWCMFPVLLRAMSAQETLEFVRYVGWSSLEQITVCHLVGKYVLLIRFDVLLLFQFFYFLQQKIDLLFVDFCFVIFSRFRRRTLCACFRLICVFVHF